jgi:hypothetical protein
MNNYNYELFLERKDELHQIFKETKTLASLYEYINYKNADYADIPDIYTYEHISFDEREDQAVDKVPQKKKDSPDKKPKKKKDSADKKPKKKKDSAEKKPKKKKDSAEKKPKKKKDSADKAAVVKVKECPEGKILNPITNRCIKDVNYKPKPK